MNPKNDGIDHINAYSKGSTEFGRFLSNFTNYPLVYPVLGYFASIEGIWYWLSSGNQSLRNLSGYQAKSFGRQVRDPHLRVPYFERYVLGAVEYKLKNSRFWNFYVTNDLPIVHYYVNKSGQAIPTESSDWLWSGLNTLRLLHRKNPERPLILEKPIDDPNYMR